MKGRGMDASDSVESQVTGCCKHSNESSASRKCGGIHSLFDEPFSF
jgi:hypothetical protein